jgi:argininosuccinate lyase
MAKLASGRVQTKSSKLLDLFNASLPFDKKLYQEDIEGSIAHATMLEQEGILTKDELKDIVDGLLKIREEIQEDKFIFEISDEDIHMAIEKRLTEIIGDAGKKLHTARSRNDQVALDFRLYVQRNTKNLEKLTLKLMDTLLDIASAYDKTMLPGMTHLQHAQPINFGFHMLAYISMFKRDVERFSDSFKRNNFSPIGCAALAGTPHNIDREFTAKLLGFDSPTVNCLDTVSDRDFALEILFNIATLMTHISRLSEELVIWSSSEFKFISLSDEYSTSSSIMPQKKNPDVPELLRGKTGRVY